MKKLFLFAILAIAGVTIAEAKGYWITVICPDGFRHSHYVVVQDGLDQEDEEDLVGEFEKDYYNKVCGTES